MAVPHFLDWGFRYLSTAGITDVNTIISDLQSELVTNGDWSEPSAGVYMMNPSTSGKFAQITTSRVSATRMQFKCSDYLGNTMYDGTVDINAAGSEVRYFTGEYYCYIDVQRTTPEAAFLIRSDPYPEPEDMDTFPYCCWAFRNSAGTATANNTLHYSFVMGATTGTYGAFQQCNYNTGSDNTVYFSGLSHSGAYMFLPMWMAHYRSGTATLGPCGRWPNTLMGPDLIAAGTELDIPVDTGVTQTFKAIGAHGTDGTWNTRLLLRKA